MVFCEHGKYIGGVKAVEIVNECCRLAQPLAVQLAPHCFSPAGVGDGQMQTVGVNIVPVFCGVEVTERVFVIVRGDLRIAGRAGGEEHQHKVVAAGCICLALKMSAEQLVFVVKAAPALALAADDYTVAKLVAALCSQLSLMG